MCDNFRYGKVSDPALKGFEMIQTVLLAGATGMLGSRVAYHLLEQPDAHVRLLARDARAKRAQLEPLLKRGAEIMDGDLADQEALNRATEGVDVIVSAVQGGPDVIIDGQVALAEAGKRNGARRILPSDYALDLFSATPGEHLMFDLRLNLWRPAARCATSCSSATARSGDSSSLIHLNP